MTQSTSHSDQGARRRQDHPTGWRSSNVVLAVVSVAQFMVIVDSTIVNVALPSIQSSLHMSSSTLTWVLNAYTLIFAGFLLLGGRAADLYGQRRLFLIGIFLFTITSLVGGMAQNSTELLAARTVQGLGAAAMSPATLTILMTTFTDAKARSRALGIWAASAGAGGATGVLTGGILTDLLSWRWILFINVPIGVLLFVAARLSINEVRATGRRPRLDWGGAVSVTAGLVAITYAVAATDTHAWTAPSTIGFLAAGVALLLIFVVIEARHSQPLVPLRLFRSRGISGSNLMILITIPTMFTSFFYLSQYLERVRGYTPMETGLAYLPMPLAYILGSQIASRLVGRIGARPFLVLGPVISAVGMLSLGRLQPDSSYALGIALPVALAIFGVSIGFVPLTLIGSSGVRPQDAGLASGLLNTSNQIGGSLGLAVLVTIATTHTKALSDKGLPLNEALTDGYARAFVVLAGFNIVAALVGGLLLPARLPKAEVEALERTPAIGEVLIYEPDAEILLTTTNPSTDEPEGGERTTSTGQTNIGARRRWHQ